MKQAKHGKTKKKFANSKNFLDKRLGRRKIVFNQSLKNLSVFPLPRGRKGGLGEKVEERSVALVVDPPPRKNSKNDSDDMFKKNGKRKSCHERLPLLQAKSKG